MFGISRAIARSARPAARSVRAPAVVASRLASNQANTGSNSLQGGAHEHESESFEAFNARYHTFFSSIDDVFELQRGLNNCFAYDLVPTTDVIAAALRASRKVNDYATAVRILEGVKEKVENKGQYKAYLDELKPVIDELGINTKEELYNIV